MICQPISRFNIIWFLGGLFSGGNHAVVPSEQVYSGVVGIGTVRTILAEY
jgi:hypothetical protein